MSDLLDPVSSTGPAEGGTAQTAVPSPHSTHSLRSPREIVERVDIAAPADRVFRALTTPTELLAWWGDRTTYPSTHWELDLRVGGQWLSRWRGPDGTAFALGGEILEVRPPHLLVYSWWDERYPGLPLTTVRYVIEEQATGGVTVTITHAGFDAARVDFDDYHGGWSTVMRKLRAHTEVRGGFRGNHDVAIEVDDLVAAEAFYAGTLGFPIRSRSDAQLELDAGRFSLWVNRASQRRSFIPSLDVAQAGAARAALVEAGCRVVRESPDGRGFYVEDPFGFVIDVIERDGGR